jgi:hypothetical protein
MTGKKSEPAKSAENYWINSHEVGSLMGGLIGDIKGKV